MCESIYGIKLRAMWKRAVNRGTIIERREITELRSNILWFDVEEEYQSTKPAKSSS